MTKVEYKKKGGMKKSIKKNMKSGKLGSAFVNASPDTIGALTVLAIDSMHYGYAMSKGDNNVYIQV